MIGQDFLELRERGGILEHGELAVGVAHIVPGAQFDSRDLDCREFLENHGKWQLRKQGSEDSYAHSGFFLLGILS